jgi:hypothetical protein
MKVELVNSLLARFLELGIPPALIPEVTRMCLNGNKILIRKTGEGITVYADGTDITN